MSIRTFELSHVDGRRFVKPTDRWINLRVDHNSTVTLISELGDRQAGERPIARDRLNRLASAASREPPILVRESHSLNSERRIEEVLVKFVRAYEVDRCPRSNMPVRNCVWRQALRQTNSGSQQFRPPRDRKPNRPLSWLTLSLTARVGFPKRGSRTPPSRGGPGRPRRSCAISSGRPGTLSFPS